MTRIDVAELSPWQVESGHAFDYGNALFQLGFRPGKLLGNP